MEVKSTGLPLGYENSKYITCTFVSALHCSIHLHENPHKNVLDEKVYISKMPFCPNPFVLQIAHPTQIFTWIFAV